jgi:hypothetical protein
MEFEIQGLFKKLVKQNVELLERTARVMVRNYNSIFNSDNFGVKFFEVYSHDRERGYTYGSNQILVTGHLFETMIKACKNTWGGNQGDKSDIQLINEIRDMIQSKIYSSSSLFIHLLNCMITDFFLKIITNFKKSNYIVQNIRQLIQFQSEFEDLWTSSTLKIIKYSNTTNRGYFGNDACQVAPFETDRQIEAGSDYEHKIKTGTQEAMIKEEKKLGSNNLIKEEDMQAIKKITRANYDSDDSQGGGKMIRNKSSVRNRVTRKRQKQQNKQIQISLRTQHLILKERNLIISASLMIQLDNNGNILLF